MKAQLAALLLWATATGAEPMQLDDFSPASAQRWQYVSDQVMGGVSEGRAFVAQEDGISFAQLRGTVSTANNGGFIQIRRNLTSPLSADSTGLQLSQRGNGEAYYLHLQTNQSRRPWQFYQARFDSSDDWQTVTLPWESFQPKGRGLDAQLSPQDITGIGIVAYGRDYEASLDVRSVSVLTD